MIRNATTSTAVKGRPLKGNWPEEDIAKEDKLQEFIDKRGSHLFDSQLTWTATYTHLSNLNQTIPRTTTHAWSKLPQSKRPNPPTPIPNALQSDPSRRYQGLKPTPPIPQPATITSPVVEHTFRYGQRVILINKSSVGLGAGRSQGNKNVDACLTFDSWTRIGTCVRLMVAAVGGAYAGEPLARNVFEIVPFDRDEDTFGQILCYGSRFRLVTMFGGRELAVCCPATSINNLPGGGDENQSLVLSQDVWSLASAFTLTPRKPAPSSIHAGPILAGDLFGLKCLAGNRLVASLREKKLLSLLAGTVFPAIAVQETGSYLMPSAMDWTFIAVERPS
ncbi:hypothetical protein BJ741DRAFT_625609 [Chytriomyces cf. hyalinus JEL632]|nr:hypothetical protein BJ741DRAFT_625609 [Chytriomyces cf. hyalinus JEL632]